VQVDGVELRVKSVEDLRSTCVEIVLSRDPAVDVRSRRLCPLVTVEATHVARGATHR
jgi:hypothetical protein